jgi:hypothetical protein
LNLADVFASAYDLGGFSRSLRHGSPLSASFPISAEDRAWAEGISG